MKLFSPTPSRHTHTCALRARLQWCKTTLIGTLMLVACLSNPLHAAAESDPLASAMRAMDKGDHGQAILILEPLVAENPNFINGWFFLGQARNRLGLWDEAKQALMQVEQLGAVTPALHRELGIAELGLGNPQAALDHLDQAADQGAEVALLRGQAMAMTGRTRTARRQLEQGLASVRGTAMESPYRNLLARLNAIPAAAPQRGRVYGSITGGWQYNDNVVVLPDDAPSIPADLTDQQDNLSFFHLNLNADLHRTEHTVAGVSATLFSTYHFDLDDFDVVDLLIMGRVSHRTGNWTLGAQAGGGYTWLGEDSLRATGLMSLSAAWLAEPDLTLGATYTLRYVDYLTNTLSDEDRSGWYHTFRFGPTLRLADNLTLSAAALVDLARPDGNSVEHDALGVELRSAWRPADDWLISGGFRYRDLDYAHDNIRTLFVKSRDDEAWTLFGQIAWRFARRWTLNLDAQHTITDSNIPAFYEYDQTVVGASVTYSF